MYLVVLRLLLRPRIVIEAAEDDLLLVMIDELCLFFSPASLPSMVAIVLCGVLTSQPLCARCGLKNGRSCTSTLYYYIMYIHTYVCKYFEDNKREANQY